MDESRPTQGLCDCDKEVRCNFVMLRERFKKDDAIVANPEWSLIMVILQDHVREILYVGLRSLEVRLFQGNVGKADYVSMATEVREAPTCGLALPPETLLVIPAGL